MSAVLPIRKFRARGRTYGDRQLQGKFLEAATGVEPVMEVLQSSVRGDGRCLVICRGAAPSNVLGELDDVW